MRPRPLFSTATYEPNKRTAGNRKVKAHQFAFSGRYCFFLRKMRLSLLSSPCRRALTLGKTCKNATECRDETLAYPILKNRSWTLDGRRGGRCEPRVQVAYVAVFFLERGGHVF